MPSVLSISATGGWWTEGASEMTMLETIRVAWEGIANNKVRALLTMLGIIIGVAAVIIMIAVSAGTEATIEEQISSLGANLLLVQRYRRPPVAGTKTLSPEDALVIAEQVKDVTGVAAERRPLPITARAGGATVDTDIIGAMPDFPDVRAAPVAEGRFISRADLDRKAKVAVLGQSAAQVLFGEADPIGQAVTLNRVRLDVIGVMAEKGMVGDVNYDDRIYVPLTTSFQYFEPTTMGQMVRTIYVQVESPEVMEDVIARIQSLLMRLHNVEAGGEDFYIETQQDIIETQQATTAAFRSLLGWVGGVSLVVGGIGIMNIMLVSVTERTREIGIRQAVGAKPGDIRLQFLLEALVLSLVGGLLGVAAGVAGSWLFGQTSDMNTVVALGSIPLAFGSAATVGVFFGFYPANKAARLDPIDALRHE
jgi:putative ABC transport system permease protein